MTGNLFTPVSVRRRSAAKGGTPMRAVRGAVGTRRGPITSTSVSGKFGSFQGITEQMKGYEISLFIPSQHLVTAPVKWG